MEYNDTIGYKTWLENLDEPAPEGAWDVIADQLDIDAAWESITQTLDLDDVWKNIETELPQTLSVSNPSAQTHFSKLFWVAAALILLTLTTPVPDNRPALEEQTYHNQSREEKIADKPEGKTIIQPNVERIDKVDKQDSRIEPSAPIAAGHERSAKSNDGEIANADAFNRLISQSVIVNADSTVVVTKLEWPVLNDSLSASVTTHVLQQYTDTLSIIKKGIESDSAITVTTRELLKDSVKKDLSERAKWHVGIIGSLKNTWLINPETANGLKSSSLNDTQLTFGKEFGITLQRSIGGRSALQLEYYFYSEIGQRYHEYINALYQTKDVRLHYQKFQVVYRTRVWRNLGAPALYAVGGIRVSRLTLADTSIGNESQEVTQEYRPWDYGFILGGEAEFILNKRLLLVSGLRGSYGLRNIYLGTGQSPGEFNKTHTASVGLVLGLKYRIN